MAKCTSRLRLIITVTAVLLVGSACPADTWRLERGGRLSDVNSKSTLEMEAAAIKQLGQEGKTKELKAALEGLKKDFPEIAGADFDLFVKAELLFCKGKFEKAFNSYEKFLNKYSESRFYQAALDREFAIGTAYLGGRKKKVLGVLRLSAYDEGAKVMEKIADRTGDAPIAVKAMTAIAENYEKRKKFEEAFQQWSLVSSRWPAGEVAKEALLGMARDQHVLYRGPNFDSSSLLSAKSYYERFKAVYPEDAEQLDIDGKLKLIDEQLAYKNFRIGLYYHRTQPPLSPGESTVAIDGIAPAALYYSLVIQDWPSSTAAGLAKTAMEEKKTINKDSK